MKKILSIFVLFIISFFLSSCKVQINTHYEVIRNKSYQFAEFLFYNNCIIEIDYSKIKDKTVVIPKYINDEPVYGIGDAFIPIFSDIYDYLSIDGSNGVKKIYFNEYMAILLPSPEILKNYNYSRYNVLNIKDIFLVCSYYHEQAIKDLNVFYDYTQYQNAENIYISKFLFDKWLNNGDYKITNGENFNIEYNDYVVTINYRIDDNEHVLYVKAANVTYYYNYNEAPNNNIYFIDNADLDVVIKPKYDPVREGYDFGGWYKEEECINEWNFQEIMICDEYKLYAKWIKK